VDSKEAMVECLKTKKVDELIPQDYKYIEFSGKERLQFEPSAETTTTGNEFITHNPVVLMKQGKIANKVPLIIGVTINDGAVPPLAAYLAKADYINKVNSEWDTKLPLLLDYKKSASDPAVVSKKIKDYYFEGKDVTQESKFRITDIVADRFFFGPALNFAIQYSAHAPTYTYVITYQGQFSNFQLEGMKKNGTAYYDDLQYEFSTKHYDVPEITKGSPDFDFSNKFVKLWSSFSENGKPTKTWGPTTAWEKFDPAKTPMALYGIDAETKPFVIPEDMLKRHGLWAELRTTVLKSEEEDPAKETF
jgi:carboxylesterase type B